MKKLFFILFSLFPYISYCQTDSSYLDLIARSNLYAQKFPELNNTQNKKPPGEGLVLSQKDIRDPTLMKKLLKKRFGISLPSTTSLTTQSSSSQTSSQCPDTSYKRLLGVYNGLLYVGSATKAADGGILVAITMFDSLRLPNPYWRYFGLLLKLDEDGNVLWIKQFEEQTPGQFSSFGLLNVFELENNDLICCGLWTSANSNTYETMVYRLNPSGSLIWKNRLKTSLSIFNSPSGSFTYSIGSAIDGLNGDVILSGTSNSNSSSGKIETVVRLNNLGQLVWDVNYGNHGVDGSYLFGAEGVSVFMKNGQIILTGLSHGTNNPETPPAINFLTLGYSTGNLISKRFFRPSYSTTNETFYKSFTYFNNKCIRLDNGHYLFYGKLFSGFVNYVPLPLRDHFGVVEFDSSFNLIKSYTLSSELISNYYNDLLYFNGAGKGLVSIFKYISSYEGDVFFGSFNNNGFLHQRKASYTNVGMPGYNSFVYLNNGGYAYLQSYFANQPNKSYVEFKKMHNSDTSSVCLGKDTTLLRIMPFSIIEDPAYFYLDPNESNKMSQFSQNLSITDTISHHFLSPCMAVSSCESLAIAGNSSVCGSTSSVIYTGTKNPGCGAVIQWDIDPAAIDSMRTLTDTTVQIWFRNTNWQGKLYGTLPGSVCVIPPRDSLLITVTINQSAVNLGADTVICNQNQLQLNAGLNYATYLWQDGSTAPTYSVTQPGNYFVTVSDACGNFSADTITVSAASFVFSAGADTFRCNNNAVSLSATTGFNNYNWSPVFFISNPNSLSVNVNPPTNTAYIVTAEKWPGCIVKDTVNVAVRMSPGIYLGSDTSFCAGAAVTLDAGPGFVSFLWNNGSTNQTISVNQQGTYFVSAVSSNSCISADTLNVLNVSPPPIFTLGPDTSYCIGTQYQYAFNVPGAGYVWGDGSTANQYTITQGGQYSLTVNAGGCSASDTVQILFKTNPSVNLGNDTIICNNNILLNALYPGAQYLWQDGSTLSQYDVLAAGSYNVAVNLNGCIARDTIRIGYRSLPNFTLGKDTTICKGQSLWLEPKLNLADSYIWQDGSTSVNYVVKAQGLYSLRGYNKCGSLTDSIYINEVECNFLMPNSFTPNGDGKNDIFRLNFPFTFKDLKFSVYNRYGELIFETRDSTKGWNGSYQSIQQPSGTYVWTISYKKQSGEYVNQSGTVNLIR